VPWKEASLLKVFYYLLTGSNGYFYKIGRYGNDQGRLSSVYRSVSFYFQHRFRTKKKQLAFLLARAQINYEDEALDETLIEIINNSKLSEHYLSLARDLDVMDPKSPEDIYKSHLEGNVRSTAVGVKVDSARANLAATYVSAFVNAGFGGDKLMTAEGGGEWIYKNKAHGMMSASASLGLVLLWGVDVGLPVIDKYLYSTEDWVVAGALLAIGLVTCGVRNESEPALALLSDYVESEKVVLKQAAIVGYYCRVVNQKVGYCLFWEWKGGGI
jgi:26S proteasome regulatory subunit N1